MQKSTMVVVQSSMLDNEPPWSLDHSGFSLPRMAGCELANTCPALVRVPRGALHTLAGMRETETAILHFVQNNVKKQAYFPEHECLAVDRIGPSFGLMVNVRVMLCVVVPFILWAFVPVEAKLALGFAAP